MSSIVDEWNPSPTTNWTVLDWFKAAGVKSDIQIADEAGRLGLITEEQIWDPKRINETKHRPTGIIKRQHALDYIMILRSIAKRHGINLFSSERFEEDARIFLISKACREAYAPPSNVELVEILQGEALKGDTWSENLSSLRNRVQPTPPLRLFGRSSEIKSVREKLERFPVAIIDGIAGEGKTALAWVAANKLCEEHRFTAFDWVTDKRSLVDIHGNELPIQVLEDEDTFFERLLVSICRQFRWLDILGATGERLVTRCADRLRQGRYLIVVDNLESVKNSETIVRQLLDILSPTYSGEPLSSRALVTSRKQLSQTDIGLISIEGLKEKDAMALIEALEDAANVSRALRDAEARQLAQSTGGNPLFIQIALRRYVLQPSAENWELIINDVTQGEHKAFDTLFGPLLAQLQESKHAVEFARCIAIELSSSLQAVEVADLWNLWQTVFENQSQNDFSDILNLLVSNRIISWHQQSCSMHALIRHYLIRNSP